MAREFLRLKAETTWGTYNNASNPIYVQLDQNNAFTMRANPVRWGPIRTAGGYNRRVQTGSAKTSLTGNLNILVYPSQQADLAPLIVATSANVLKSFTADHGIVMEDGSSTKVYRRYLGCMVQQASFTSGEQNQLCRWGLQLIAKQPATITSTDLPEPAVTDYPSDSPYVFENASGAFTFGSSRAEFEEFNITIKNMLDPRFMASQYLTRLKYAGRDVDYSTRFPYITTTDRSNYESVTAVSASITYTSGSNSMAFQFNSKNFLAKVDDDLALDKVYLQGVDGECYFDPSAGTPNDFSLTVV